MKTKNKISNSHIVDVYVSFADITFERDRDSDYYHKHHKYSRYQIDKYYDIYLTVMSAVTSKKFHILKIERRKKNETLFVTIECPNTSEIYLIRFQIQDIRGTDILSERMNETYFRRLAINDVEYTNRLELLDAMSIICSKIKERTYRGNYHEI